MAQTKQSRQDVIKAAIPTTDLTSLRPLMTSLNGDNSWLFSFPRPAEEIKKLGKVYFHIVFEPWLAGPASGNMQLLTLSKAAAYTGPDDVEKLIADTEATATQILGLSESKDHTVDAIMLTFHYLDHVHEPTLKLFNKKIPVVATRGAADVIEPWNHFENITIIQEMGADDKTWQSNDLHPAGLPSWLTVVQMMGETVLNFCSAIIWTHADSNGDQIHDTILHSPHGTKDTGALGAFLSSQPPTQPLAMMHALKEGYIGTIFWKHGAGVRGGLELHRRVGSKYWIVSHSAELIYTGLMMWLMWVYDTQKTLDWGLSQEKKGSEKPLVVQVDNGSTIAL